MIGVLQLVTRIKIISLSEISQLACDKVSINFLKVVAQIFITRQHVYMFAWTFLNCLE